MNDANLIELTADIVSAFIANNAVGKADIGDLIASTHASLTKLGEPIEPAEQVLVPRVSVKKSMSDEYLISLEDGKRYKSLKRHIGGLGMSPEAYRAKWNLPASYPMVAPAYARKRSELAKSMGLGRKRVAIEEPVPAPKAKKPRKAAAAASE